MSEGDHLENPGVDRTIILKLISENWDGGQGQVVGTCKYGNELRVA